MCVCVREREKAKNQSITHDSSCLRSPQRSKLSLVPRTYNFEKQTPSMSSSKAQRNHASKKSKRASDGDDEFAGWLVSTSSSPSGSSCDKERTRTQTGGDDDERVPEDCAFPDRLCGLEAELEMLGLEAETCTIKLLRSTYRKLAQVLSLSLSSSCMLLGFCPLHNHAFICIHCVESTS